MWPFSWVGQDLKAFRQARAKAREEERRDAIRRALEQIAANGMQADKGS